MSDEDAFDLGVVFVHGIGSQSTGASLVAAAEALQQWFQRWFDGATQRLLALGVLRDDLLDWGRDLVERQRREGAREEELDAIWAMVARLGRSAPKGHSETVLGEVVATAGLTVLGGRATLVDGHFRRQSEEPPHVVLRLQVLLADGGVRRARWLLAEAWWAQSFPPPRFATLAAWGFRFVPWLVTTHLREYVTLQRRRRAAEAARWPWWHPRRLAGIPAELVEAFALFAAVLLGPFAQLVLLALTALALLPVRAVRRTVVRVQQSLAASAGDSFVLVNHPAWAAAMTGQVRRAQDWVRERAAVVAVVGHSQGAAVAYEAVAEDRERWPSLLITYGSGLRKLQGLRQLAARRGSRRSLWVSWAGSVGAVLFVGGWTFALLAPRFQFLGFLATWLGQEAVGQALFPNTRAPEEVPNPAAARAERIDELLEEDRPARLRWLPDIDRVDSPSSITDNLPSELTEIVGPWPTLRVPLPALDLIEVTPAAPPIPVPGLGLETFDPMPLAEPTGSDAGSAPGRFKRAIAALEQSRQRELKEEAYWSQLRQRDPKAYVRQRFQLAAWQYAQFRLTRGIANELAELKRHEAERVAASLRWRDLWASHDPVPNGPTPVPDWTRVDVDIVEVFNRASFLADHTAYWANMTDFVPRVAHELDGVSPSPVLVDEPARAQALPVALGRQRSRALLAGGARRAALAAALVTSVAFRDQWRVTGDRLLGWVAKVTDQGWLDRFLPDVGRLRGTLAASVVGAVALGVLVAGALVVVQRILWAISEGREQRLLFDAGPFLPRPVELRALFGVAAAAFAAAVVLLLPFAFAGIAALVASLLAGLLAAWQLPALPTFHEVAGDPVAAKERWAAFLRQPAGNPSTPEPASVPPTAMGHLPSQPGTDT